MMPRLSLPIVCAPMFLVSGPDLVRECCLAGIVGVLPRQNARTLEQYDQWLTDIRSALERARTQHADRVIGPLVANLPAKLPPDEIARTLAIARKHGVTTVISVGGSPREVARQAHALDMQVLHSVTSVLFAEKALDAGADGLIAIGSGGGGHSGTLSHLVLVPRIRAMFTGPLIAAGGIASGHSVRAMQALGADLAYMGTRFIATAESMAPAAYKRMLVEQTSEDLVYTSAITGVPANWLLPSLVNAGITSEHLNSASTRTPRSTQSVKPWKDVWSAGQAIDLIDDVPTVAELVSRLAEEYAASDERISASAGFPLPIAG